MDASESRNVRLQRTREGTRAKISFGGEGTSVWSLRGERRAATSDEICYGFHPDPVGCPQPMHGLRRPARRSAVRRGHRSGRARRAGDGWLGWRPRM